MKNTNNLPKYVRLNKQVRPQDDFYAYVCHHWRQANPIPAHRGWWSLFDKLQAQIDQRIRSLLQTWQQTSNLKPDQRQALLLYETYQKRDFFQAQSLQTLQALRRELTKLEANQTGLAKLLGLAHSQGLAAIINLDVSINTKDSQRYSLFIDPCDFNLPNRDYYLIKGKRMRRFRAAYLDFLQTYQQLLADQGFPTTISPAEILEIEQQLAKFSWPVHKEANIEKTYNPFSWEAFNETFPFAWSTYFQFAETPPMDLIVSQPSYLKDSLTYLQSLDFKTVQAYLIFQLGLRYAPLLGEEFFKAEFQFFGVVIGGHQQLESLEHRAARYTNTVLCDVIGQAYVKKFFSAAQRKEAQQLADQVGQALDRRLATNTWMSAKSKTYARQKLSKIIVNIGFGRHWANYKNLRLVEDNPLLNDLRIHRYQYNQYLNLLNQTPNRQAFGATHEHVQKANAWTNLFLLTTNYPAGFLQPPFYDHQQSPAYNLGALGSVIGHELTHNFDQAGAVIDQAGSLNPWLSKQEQKAFKRATAKLLKTANQHYPAPKVKMKGRQVIDELIADLGGLEIVIDAVKHLYPQPAQQKSALRTLFIAYAFSHATNTSLPSKIMAARSDVHPDAVFRVNGVLAHCHTFYEIFNVQEGDALYIKPSARALIW